jgi:hypothetical protein
MYEIERQLGELAVDTEFWYHYLCAGGTATPCEPYSPIR